MSIRKALAGGVAREEGCGGVQVEVVLGRPTESNNCPSAQVLVFSWVSGLVR